MIRLVIGMKERGKTTLAYSMARRVSPRLAIFDPRGLIRRPGATIARTAASCAAGFDMLADGDTTEMVYTPNEHLKSVAFPAFAAELRYWVYERRLIPLAVLVDELAFVDVGDDFDQALKACDATAHHFFLTCHRPADVPTDVRALADFWYVFAVHQEHDLEVLRRRCSAELADAARQLDGRTFAGWNHREGVKLYANPAAWYVDLSPELMLVPPLELDAV